MDLFINKDTQLCMSLSERPGQFGTRFQNFLYRELGLNFVYKAFATRDIASALIGMRALGIRGSAISMPFKEKCMESLDTLDTSAERVQSVNTIVHSQVDSKSFLKGYNTDYGAVRELLKILKSRVEQTSFIVFGSGGMAKAVVCALYDLGFQSGCIVSRNRTTGQALAEKYGYAYIDSNLHTHPEADLLINVSPLGMSGKGHADALPFTESQLQASRCVFDVVAVPSETPLIQRARALKKEVITGDDVIVLQAVEQFVLYTGVRPSAELVQRAAAFARLPVTTE